MQQSGCLQLQHIAMPHAKGNFMALCGCKLWERHCSLIKGYLMSSTLQFRLRHVSYFCLIEQMQDQDDQTKPMRTRQFHVVGAHFDDSLISSTVPLD